MPRVKKENVEQTSLLLLQRFFVVTRIRLIWLDIFVFLEQLECEEEKLRWLDKSAYFWTSESW